MLILDYLFASLGVSDSVRSQRGATLIEYVLIVAVIAIAVFAAANFGLKTAITGLFTKAASTISSS